MLRDCESARLQPSGTIEENLEGGVESLVNDDEYKRFLKAWNKMHHNRIRRENIAIVCCIVGIVVIMLISRFYFK